jgi:P-loop containing dynein motor region D4
MVGMSFEIFISTLYFCKSVAKDEQGGELVITQDFLQSVAKIDRVLSSPGGSLLLCGKAGAGRKSAVRLVSLMHGSKVATLNVTTDYSVKNFKKELKAVRFILIKHLEFSFLN